MKKELRETIIRKKGQPWKIDVYVGIKGEKRHSHKTLSGAILLDGQAVGGDIYYHRDIDGKVLINKDEKGNDLLS